MKCVLLVQRLKTPNKLNSDYSFSTNDEYGELLPGVTEINMTPANIRQCQELVKDLQPIIDYLSNGTLPHLQQKSRTVLIQQSDYVLMEGMLFHSRVAKAKRTQIMSQYQLVLPQTLIPFGYKTVSRLAIGSTWWYSSHNG